MAQASLANQQEIDCEFDTCLVCGQESIQSQLIIIGLVRDQSGRQLDGHYKQGCPACHESHLLHSCREPGAVFIDEIFKRAEQRRAALGTKAAPSIKKLQKAFGYVDENEQKRLADVEARKNEGQTKLGTKAKA